MCRTHPFLKTDALVGTYQQVLRSQQPPRRPARHRHTATLSSPSFVSFPCCLSSLPPCFWIPEKRWTRLLAPYQSFHAKKKQRHPRSPFDLGRLLEATQKVWPTVVLLTSGLKGLHPCARVAVCRTRNTNICRDAGGVPTAEATQAKSSEFDVI